MEEGAGEERYGDVLEGDCAEGALWFFFTIFFFSFCAPSFFWFALVHTTLTLFRLRDDVHSSQFFFCIALQAPHHSRASWMKFYRRHKHELNHTEEDEPLPLPPEKKMRYSRSDDILLARFFLNKPDGTSDKIFQGFARDVSLLPYPSKSPRAPYALNVDHLSRCLAPASSVERLARASSDT